eukprot:SAG25_NODE_1520_length_2854_cov_1.931034_2_plen_74_part_00
MYCLWGTTQSSGQGKYLRISSTCGTLVSVGQSGSIGPRSCDTRLVFANPSPQISSQPIVLLTVLYANAFIDQH